MTTTKLKSIDKQTILDLVQAHGLYVIPLCSFDSNNKCTCGNVNCSSPGKHPHFRYNWKLTASNDLNQIKSWILKYKNLNWGILTGRKSNVNGKYLIVVDVDNNEHKIVKKLPNTFSYSTGNGFHYWFWSNEKISNSVSKLDVKVDIRCSNGYVVVPPSKHKSGKQYKMLGNSIEISDLPEFILKEITEKTSNSKIEIENWSEKNKKQSKSNKTEVYDITTLRKMLEKKKKIPIGIRNISIHKLLSSDRAKGLEKDDLYVNALKYLEFVEEPETFNLSEISKIIDSVLKYPPYCTLNNYSKLSPDYISLNKVNPIDFEFFNKIKQTNTITTTLNNIMLQRNMWNIKNNIQESEMRYFQMQELSILLQEIGIKKKRTKQGNVWFCDVGTKTV